MILENTQLHEYQDPNINTHIFGQIFGFILLPKREEIIIG